MTDQETRLLRAEYATRFGVPDGGQYSNDWAGRIDAVLVAVRVVEAERGAAVKALNRIAWAHADAAHLQRIAAEALDALSAADTEPGGER